MHMGKINQSLINGLPSIREGPAVFKVNNAKVINLKNTVFYHIKVSYRYHFLMLALCTSMLLFVSVL